MIRQVRKRRRVVRDERGMSAGVEVALVVPVLLLFIMAVIMGGRIALARQAVQAAATDAARSASIARTAPQARVAASSAAASSLANQQLACAATSVEVDVSGFAVPVGLPASVQVRVVCEVKLSDLVGVPGGPIRTEATMTSPLDTYRERR